MARSHLYILSFSNVANSETSAALLRVPSDGSDIAYICIDEERLARQKQTYRLPLRAIDYCMKGFGLESLRQIDYIFTDHGSLPRYLNSTPSYRKIEHDYLKLMLDFPREKIRIVDHHCAHAASAFYPSGFGEAAVLVVDGFGSRLNTQSLFHMKGLEVREIERGDHWGIGALYALVTRGVLPYGPEKGFGKVMGLAPYGRTQPGPVLAFNPRDEGLTTDYSAFYSRLPTGRIQADVRYCDDRERVLDPYFARAAFDVQQEQERQIVRMARYAYEKTGCEAICLAGGSMLNGLANARVLADTPFTRIWIQPAASDTGAPFGMALWGYYQVLLPELPEPRKVAGMRFPNAYTARAYPRAEAEALLGRHNVAWRETTPEEVAGFVADGKVIAWYEGAAEFGPRALGHRSIVADPRRKEMWNYLNTAVKFREAYRPYAPSVLAEHAHDWFDLRSDSPFMMQVVTVKADKRAQVPAITHVDHTSRPQTVTAEANPNYHRLISAFHALTGVPMVLNTSLNVNKEPIVESPADALLCAFGTAIDWLYLDGLLIDCRAHATPERLKAINEERQTWIEQEWTRVRGSLLRGYDEDECRRYLAEENKISEWYRDYRAKYELEKAMVEWRAHGSRILIVGTRRHTACLYLYIADFPQLSIAGFVALDDLPGEQGSFDALPELSLAAVDWAEIDAVLISSHEYQAEAVARVRQVKPRWPVVTLYDESCDSLLYVLPGRWPVMNPDAAKDNGVTLARQIARSASSIDFDFDDGSVDVSQRYGFCLAYRAPLSLAGVQAAGSDAAAPARFARDIAALSQSFAFTTLDRLLDPAADLPETNGVLAILGASRAVADTLLPALERRGVVASLFVTPSAHAQPLVPLPDKVALLEAALGADGLRAAIAGELGEARVALEEPTRLGIMALLPGLPGGTAAVRSYAESELPLDVATRVIGTLFARRFGDEAAAARALYLTPDELRALASRGHRIGLLPQRLGLLSRLSLAEQQEELRSAMDALTGLLGTAPAPTLAYPYGAPGSWNTASKRAASDLRLRGALCLGRRIVKPKDIKERWEIPAFLPDDLIDDGGLIRAEALAGIATRE